MARQVREGDVRLAGSEKAIEAPQSIIFTIPGPFVSGNNAKTKDGRRTTASRAFDMKVALLAKAAVRACGWVMPEYVTGTITVVNVRMDWDNLAKELMDPLQGIVMPFDSRAKDMRVVMLRVKNYPEEAIVTLYASDGKAYGYPKPLKTMPKIL